MKCNQPAFRQMWCQFNGIVCNTTATARTAGQTTVQSNMRPTTNNRLVKLLWKSYGICKQSRNMLNSVADSRNDINHNNWLKIRNSPWGKNKSHTASLYAKQVFLRFVKRFVGSMLRMRIAMGHTHTLETDWLVVSFSGAKNQSL